MTATELAKELEELAASLRLITNVKVTHSGTPLLREEYAIGAALFWSYLRDLFTSTNKEVFTRDEILVLLEAVQRDSDMFLPGTVEKIADAWKED